MKNKQLIASAANLQSRSNAAITAFKDLIAGLKATNEQAEASIIANNAQITSLQEENAAIAELSEKNVRIVQNIERLLELD